MSKTRDAGLHEDFQGDLSNNDYDNERFSSFMPQMSSQLSEEEIALRDEMKLLKQAKKLFSDLNQELASQRVKPEPHAKLSRTTEQAKEEAMKLLKSGAISFDTGNERHVFKRKLKESDGGDSEDIPEPGKGRKFSLYDNFVAGERINPTILPTNRQKPSTALHDSPQDSRHDFDTGMLPHKLSLPDFESEGRRNTGGSTIYISFNDINEASVREILEPYGPILNIRIDEKKCYGFVTLKSPEIAERALMLDRSRFNNNRLRVSYARRQHRVQDMNFEDNFERSSLRPTPRAFSAMLSRLVVRRGCRFPHQLNMLRNFSINSTPECVVVYVSADRAKFYKSLGLFCLAQGSIWLIFGQYLLLKCDQPVTWDVMKGDVCEFTRRLATRLESWTPDAVAKVIFQSRRTPQVEENLKVEEANDARIDDAKRNTVKGENTSDMEIMVDRMRETFGIKTAAENANKASQKERDRTKRLVPYLCLIMGAFTLFVGGFIPRRVIRRVSLVQWKSTQAAPNDRNNPMMRVNTYGWFGLFPRRGALFTTRLNNIRATAEYREGKRFMNLIIVRRPFAFYLERLEAEFILPEYFEHLNSRAISKR